MALPSAVSDPETSSAVDRMGRRVVKDRRRQPDQVVDDAWEVSGSPGASHAFFPHLFQCLRLSGALVGNKLDTGNRARLRRALEAGRSSATRRRHVSNAEARAVRKFPRVDPGWIQRYHRWVHHLRHQHRRRAVWRAQQPTGLPMRITVQRAALLTDGAREADAIAHFLPHAQGSNRAPSWRRGRHDHS